jgi:hypothetical protein
LAPQAADLRSFQQSRACNYYRQTPPAKLRSKPDSQQNQQSSNTHLAFGSMWTAA